MDNYEDNPTAKILLRFAAKQSVDVSEAKQKQSKARKEITEQARRLTDATNKEKTKAEQLNKARNARSKKATTEE